MRKSGWIDPFLHLSPITMNEADGVWLISINGRQIGDRTLISEYLLMFERQKPGCRAVPPRLLETVQESRL